MPWQNDGMEIRARIRKVLAENPDWTPRSISLKAGLSDSMLHKFLTEQTKSMTLETLEKIAEALEVNPRWLIFGDRPRQIDPKVVDIWDRINERNKPQALRVLESFTGDEESHAG